MNDCREYLARHVVAAEGGEELPKGDPVNDLETIARLYFPELKNETDAFLEMHRRLVFGRGEAADLLSPRRLDQASKRKSHYADQAARTKVIEAKKISAALTDAARKLLETIMGVER